MTGVVVFLFLPLGCGDNNEDRWKNEFPAVQARINSAMLTPVAALLEVFGCETQEECDASLRRLPRALGPASEHLQKEITTLEALEPPAQYQPLHSSYLQTLKVRLEAFELYIAGVEQNDNTLLEAGDDAWTRAQIRQSQNLAFSIGIPSNGRGFKSGSSLVDGIHGGPTIIPPK